MYDASLMSTKPRGRGLRLEQVAERFEVAGRLAAGLRQAHSRRIEPRKPKASSSLKEASDVSRTAAEQRVERGVVDGGQRQPADQVDVAVAVEGEGDPGSRALRSSSQR